MKKITAICILALAVFTTSSWAQPVITGINGAPIGTKSLGYDIPGVIVPGLAGASQVWDYSAIPYNPSTYYFKTVDYAGLSQAIKDSFPTATGATEYYLNGNLTATLLFKLEAADFLYLGLNTTPFAVPDTQLVFPHNYLETHAGFTYDAYGTLKTPFGTYNNVVRLRETVAGNFKYDYWQFSPVYTVLMEYKVDTITQAVTGQAFYNIAAATSVKESADMNEMSVFPNPASDDIYIRTSLTGNASIEIYDAIGRVMLNKNILLQTNTPYKLDVSCMQQGMYFVKINNEAKSYSQKIIIQ